MFFDQALESVRTMGKPTHIAPQFSLGMLIEIFGPQGFEAIGRIVDCSYVMGRYEYQAEVCDGYIRTGLTEPFLRHIYFTREHMRQILAASLPTKPQPAQVYGGDHDDAA